MTFECHYCPKTFPDFTGLVRHFEAVHRDRDEYIVREFPADEDGMPIIELEEGE
jgi:hypothetical protein